MGPAPKMRAMSWLVTSLSTRRGTPRTGLDEGTRFHGIAYGRWWTWSRGTTVYSAIRHWTSDRGRQ